MKQLQIENDKVKIDLSYIHFDFEELNLQVGHHKDHLVNKNQITEDKCIFILTKWSLWWPTCKFNSSKSKWM